MSFEPGDEVEVCTYEETDGKRPTRVSEVWQFGWIEAVHEDQLLVKLSAHSSDPIQRGLYSLRDVREVR